MKYTVAAICGLLTITSPLAQTHADSPRPAHHVATGTRQYSVFVNQTDDTLKMNTRLRHLNNNRGILYDIASGYLSLGTTTLLSTSKSILDVGVNALKELARDKRPDWEKAVMEESSFRKFLPMQTQILDFYAKPSPNGALDPLNMKFTGFGCRQMITVYDSLGNAEEKEVFALTCRVRDDDEGLARMLNHSKFEVVVDELRFNPYLCNLPNDSINASPETRIEFSFDKRKNLMFTVDALISSSWINEAIQVHDNVNLGKFTINAFIDPDLLDEDNVFRYNREKDKESGKQVSVTGDCFLVPRSYIGSADMKSASDTWGTGQYRIDMIISETCQINEPYYKKLKNGKSTWNKKKWNSEWQKIRRRRPAGNIWQQIKSTVTKNAEGEQWITTISEPITTSIIEHEKELLKALGQQPPKKP